MAEIFRLMSRWLKPEEKRPLKRPGSLPARFIPALEDRPNCHPSPVNRCEPG